MSKELIERLRRIKSSSWKDQSGQHHLAADDEDTYQAIKAAIRSLSSSATQPGDVPEDVRRLAVQYAGRVRFGAPPAPTTEIFVAAILADRAARLTSQDAMAKALEDLMRQTGNLASASQAFLAHFNEHDLPEDKAQQWLSVFDQIHLVQPPIAAALEALAASRHPKEPT